MKLVIDIPEDVYTRLFDNGIQDNEIATDDICEMVRSLRLGTPLPKGHGDLIDRNDLLEYTDSNICAYTPTINRYDIITTPTIIESDKSESEEP